MYRRSWNGSAYAYELTPVDLKPYLKDGGIGNISWQLDTEDLNVWRVSNVQLELKNEHGEFNEGSGVFFNSNPARLPADSAMTAVKAPGRLILTLPAAAAARGSAERTGSLI